MGQRGTEVLGCLSDKMLLASFIQLGGCGIVIAQSLDEDIELPEEIIIAHIAIDHNGTADYSLRCCPTCQQLDAQHNNLYSLSSHCKPTKGRENAKTSEALS